MRERAADALAAARDQRGLAVEAEPVQDRRRGDDVVRGIVDPGETAPTPLINPLGGTSVGSNGARKWGETSSKVLPFPMTAGLPQPAVIMLRSSNS